MKYKDYFNFELGNRDIYSHNDILGMTVQDVLNNELPLSYQYHTIGIPKDDELSASPNTHQYKNANGKLRWRSSSKTWEELLEEERQRRQMLQMQNQNVQSQLGSKTGGAAPVNNLPQQEPEAAPIQENESSLLNTAAQNALTNILGAGIDKLKTKPQQLSENPIMDAAKNYIETETTEPQSPIMQALQSEMQQEKTPNSFDPLLQMDNLLQNKEDVITGAAAPLVDDDYKKILNNGIEKYLGLPNGTTDALNNIGKKFLEKGINKNDNMTFSEEVQDFLYEKALNKKYPMASNATIDGMRDFESAKKQKYVQVHNDMNAIANSKYKSYLKTLGASDDTPGVVYDVNSDVSKTMSNSPELESYLVTIRDKVIKGEKLDEYYDFKYDASATDVLNGNDDKVSRMATFRNIRMYDPQVDENGVFTCKLVDYSDFKKESKGRLQAIPNNWGASMQQKGLYKNYYQVVNIRRKIHW